MDLHKPVDPNKTYDQMTSEERLRYDHQKLHELHRGHESMHTTMVLILIATLIVAQIVVMEWKKRHYRSYSFFTMLAMWVIPVAMSLKNQWWRFIGIWLVFSLCTALVIRKSSYKPISATTPRVTISKCKQVIQTVFLVLLLLTAGHGFLPIILGLEGIRLLRPHAGPVRGGALITTVITYLVTTTGLTLVYKWFYLIYKLSCVIGIMGYVLMMLTFIGVNMMFGQKPQLWMDFALLFLFYGLYFGVLGRDVAEYCTDKIAASIGYYTQDGMPTRHLENNVCAVCGNKLLVDVDEEGVLENTYKLPCGHVFHEFCIRGWCIVGKRQTCPYCKEKVDLKRMFTNPWDRPHILYGQLLDWIRWLVAWQPLILFLAQGINWLFGLE